MEMSEKEREDLEGKCNVIYEYTRTDKDDAKWRGEGCDCPIVQGNYVCKLNPF